MAALFADYPEALETTVAIADRCAASTSHRISPTRFPDYPTDPGETPDDLLERVCREQLRPSATRRNEHGRLEAAAGRARLVIAKHELAGFFLLHRDLLLLAREVADEVRGIEPRGRAPTCRPAGAAARRSARSSAT